MNTTVRQELKRFAVQGWSHRRLSSGSSGRRVLPRSRRHTTPRPAGTSKPLCKAFLSPLQNPLKWAAGRWHPDKQNGPIAAIGLTAADHPGHADEVAAELRRLCEQKFRAAAEAYEALTIEGAAGGGHQSRRPDPAPASTAATARRSAATGPAPTRRPQSWSQPSQPSRPVPAAGGDFAGSDGGFVSRGPSGFEFKFAPKPRKPKAAASGAQPCGSTPFSPNSPWIWNADLNSI